MTNDGGLRIATGSGAMLADPESLGELPALAQAEGDAIFDPAFWARREELAEVAAGRGAAWFIAVAPGQWVLRHYRRGGLIARLSRDRYIWAGENRVRAFAEWRLLAELAGRGLPVPKPIAARYQRRGFLYRCDLITQRIEDARPLSAVLSVAPLPEGAWREVGAVIRRLHGAGADHADLNAHNVLLDGIGAVSVIDFDRGKLRAPSGRRRDTGRRFAWQTRNLSRLRRSLLKISRHWPEDRFGSVAWEWLLAGYGAN